MQRYWAQILAGKSPVRAAMNVMLAESGEWGGRILDVGGIGEPPPSYRGSFRLAEGSEVVTVNIDPGSKPTMVADAAALPVADASFDNAWCLNTLEHVRTPDSVIREIFRVLKPGSRLVLFTPFLVRVHGHPQDFFRYTDAALRDMCVRAGFMDIEIRLAHGSPFMAAVSQIQPVLPRFLFVLSASLASSFDLVVGRIRPWTRSAWPLGFLVTCRKPA